MYYSDPLKSLTTINCKTVKWGKIFYRLPNNAEAVSVAVITMHILNSPISKEQIVLYFAISVTHTLLNI